MNPGSDIVIVGAGLVTPIGLSLPETAASARSRVARLRECAWHDRRFEPYVVGQVPDDGLPDLAPALTELPLQPREARMLRLAGAAIEEALAPLARLKPGPVPLMLGLPEHHTTLPLVPAHFLHRLSLQCPGVLDRDASLAAPRGRAAGLAALPHATARLATGKPAFMLVGGVDSLVDLYVLGTLDLEGRIRHGANSDGFTPSEGAAMLLLTRAETARARGLQPLARVCATGQGQEPGHLYAEAPYLGEGLAAAVAQVFAGSPPPAPVASVWCSFNGERYWAREFSVARTREARHFAPAHAMEHPAECFGDLGAAHGPALAALAAHALHHRYRPSPGLVLASSDRGDRAASLLAAA
jgi:3-oxoacyl-[acyl-carrier-protein] synthase I